MTPSGDVQIGNSVGWTLVERYCESFKDDDFRLVFERDGETLEIAVPKEVHDAFGKLADAQA